MVLSFFFQSDNEEEVNNAAILLHHVIDNIQNSSLYMEDDEMCEPSVRITYFILPDLNLFKNV